MLTNKLYLVIDLNSYQELELIPLLHFVVQFYKIGSVQADNKKIKFTKY